MQPRWEYGSEHHWVDLRSGPQTPILPAGTELFTGARSAFQALLRRGMEKSAWKRCHVPTYFCQEVTAAIAASGIQVCRYEDSPLQDRPSISVSEFSAQDVILLVNYFGLRGIQASHSLAGGPAVLIEDHTHDPWSRWAASSQADYCVASLRKLLPVGDGAALWSPRNHTLPSTLPARPQEECAAWKKTVAMLLKRLYLEGAQVEKTLFRQLQVESEMEFGGGPPSAASNWTRRILPVLPWQEWREARAANHRWLRDACEQLPGIDVVAPVRNDGACPFSMILVFESASLRETVRADLIAANIYPAVLWPLNEHVGREAFGLSQRMLSIPCDFRYCETDLDCVVRALSDSLTTNAS